MIKVYATRRLAIWRRKQYHPRVIFGVSVTMAYHSSVCAAILRRQTRDLGDNLCGGVIGYLAMLLLLQILGRQQEA